MRTKIALLVTNRNKYSETFIQAHIRSLANVIVYSDGYFPTSVSLDRGKSWDNLPKNQDPESILIQSWKENDINTVFAEYGPAGVEVMHACKKANLPLVVHFHGFDAYRDDCLNHYGESYKELFQLASKIIVVSNDMKAQVLSLGCSIEKIELLPYGIDTDFFSLPDSSVKRHHFLACGRFVPKKSPLSTIKAFAEVVEKHPNAKLTFIGDGELMDDAVSLSEKLNLGKHIEFKGVLSPDQVVLELQKHAIFVQHSIKTDKNDSEGTPLSILEAASTGLAIVATKHGGIQDVIIDGESGLLVEERDVHRMSECMLTLLEDDELRNQFGAKARAKVLADHDQSNYIKSIEKILEDAEVSTVKESKLSVWKKRMIVFLVLFLIAEISLRFVGYKPGVIEDFYYHRGELQYDSLLYADEVGITHVVQGSRLLTDGEINSEGFFSTLEFTEKSMDAIRQSGKKIVMLIGDSFTQGCCADNFNATFAQILNQSDDYVVLNFGIPGADPVQYRLIVEKYAPKLKPDLILVAVYGGNDILEYDRTAKPFIPNTYPIKNGPWLNSEGPIYLTKQGTYFKSFDEAKAHYFEYFSLWSDRSSPFEKTIRSSIIFSRPYLKWKTRARFEKIKHQMPKKLDNMPYSQENLEQLLAFSTEQNIPVQYALIPSPSDVINGINLKKKYGFVFGSIPYHIPEKLMIEDYDGVEDANHFNNKGHRKYARFLSTLIDVKLPD